MTCHLTLDSSVCSRQLRCLFASHVRAEAPRPVALRSRKKTVFATLPLSEVPVVRISSLNNLFVKQTDNLQNSLPDVFENHREYIHSL